MKLAIITCYKDPDYIRARTLRAALATLPDIETIVIKNRHTGLLKYPEVLAKVVRARFTDRPDAYLVTFRGYEILPAMLLLTFGKPLIFDEFVNPLEVVSEHRQQKGAVVGLLMSLWMHLGWIYYQMLRACQRLLTDTPAHAAYTARLSRLPLQKYVSIAVGTDEDTFKVRKPQKPNPKKFEVFFYGNMLPLHGLEYVLQAATQLKNVHFLIIGGDKRAADQVAAARQQGANISYKKWVKFDDIPELIQNADLCLAGPFGNTIQSQYVTNGRTYQFLASQAPVVVGKTNDDAKANGLVDKQNCLVIPQGDGNALAQAITWAQAHPKELSNIAGNGRQLFEERYSAKVLGQQLGELLRNL